MAEPVGKQLDFYRHSTARLNVADGSVRAGKTVGANWRWIKHVRTGPSGDLLMAGKTERTLYRNVLSPLQDLVGSRRLRLVRGEGEAHMFGRRIYLVGMNDARAEEKIRGMTLAGAYCDEITTWPESAFRMLTSRLSLKDARLFGTTNPDGPNHWLKRDYLDKADTLNLYRCHFTLRDNPHLPREYVDDLSKEYVGLWYKRFILGQWVMAEGAVYDGFDPDGPQVVDHLPDMLGWWLAIDYGTANPFVALLIGEGIDGRLYVAREWRWDSRQRLRQLTDAQYAKALLDWQREGFPGRAKQQGEPDAPPLVDVTLEDPPSPEWTIVDPSAASFIRQLHYDGWSGIRQADNTVLDGIRTTAALLGAGRLRFHRSCTGLLDEMSGYVWDPKAQEHGEDAPLKVGDHGPDALRYGIMGLRSVWRGWIGDALAAAA